MNLIDLYRVDIFILVILPTIVLFISYILCPNCYGKNKSSTILSPDIEFKNYDNNKIVGVKNIINSHNDNTFFSLALVGDWGSGKSSFLKKLKKEIELKNKDIVIYLNVWELENIQNILQEIEKEFDNIIFKLSPVEWIIYHLKSILVKSYFSLLSKYFTENDIKIVSPFSNTIKDSKDDYNNLLKRVLDEKKIVLMLDELDRLESKEDVLNIFKVIRYLTSFDKVFTITGLDINKLPKGIELEYTHKIFNSKYVIPKTTRRELLSFITEEGSKQQLDFIDKEEFKAILNTNIRNIDLCLIDFIKNYREAKSILNDTYLFCNSLKENPRFKDNWNEFINFELILVLNILKCVNLEFYQKLMNSEENIKVLIINNLELVEIEKLFKKFSEEIKSAQNKNEESVLNQFLKTQKIFNIFKNKKFIITNLDQQIYVYTHQNIYEYMFTENEYKDFIEVKGKIEHKINKLDEITIQKNNQQSDKDKFIILLIKRLYYETNIPNIEKVIKEIFKNIELLYFTNNIIHHIFESNFKLNIIDELFKFYLNNIDRENKDLIENLISKVFNIDQKYVLIKLLFKYLKNSNYEYFFKKLFFGNLIIEESINELKRLIILIDSIFEEDYNTFLKDKEIYPVYLATKVNSFSLKDISGQELKKIINKNTELQEEFKKYKESKSENKGEK